MLKVLVVDDAIFMRNALKSMLEKNGYQVVGEAENGKVAVEKYKELNPDIVTMDITMPEMNGIQALQEIKQIDVNPKIVIISALGQECHVKEAVVLGAKGFLVKPFKEDQLIKVLTQLV